MRRDVPDWWYAHGKYIAVNAVECTHCGLVIDDAHPYVTLPYTGNAYNNVICFLCIGQNGGQLKVAE